REIAVRGKVPPVQVIPDSRIHDRSAMPRGAAGELVDNDGMALSGDEVLLRPVRGVLQADDKHVPLPATNGKKVGEIRRENAPLVDVIADRLADGAVGEQVVVEVRKLCRSNEDLREHGQIGRPNLVRVDHAELRSEEHTSEL